MLPGRLVTVGGITMWYLGLGCGIKWAVRDVRRAEGTDIARGVWPAGTGLARRVPFLLAYDPLFVSEDLGLENLPSMVSCVGARPGLSGMNKRVRRNG